MVQNRLLPQLRQQLQSEASLSPAVRDQIDAAIEALVRRLSEMEKDLEDLNSPEAVDFPEFVSELIKGVCDAMIDATITQMEAYSDVLTQVTKSIDRFMADTVSDKDARQSLAQRYPDTLFITDKVGITLRRCHPHGDKDLQSIAIDLGFNKRINIVNDDDSLKRVLEVAKVRYRQQLLRETVLMGINRIVVTDGRIS